MKGGYSAQTESENILQAVSTGNRRIDMVTGQA